MTSHVLVDQERESGLKVKLAHSLLVPGPQMTMTPCPSSHDP